jgi:hypothetical protein
MMARRRINPPWIPGFWPLLAFLLLAFAIFGYYYLLGHATAFERRPDRPEPAAAAK